MGKRTLKSGSIIIMIQTGSGFAIQAKKKL